MATELDTSKLSIGGEKKRWILDNETGVLAFTREEAVAHFKEVLGVDTLPNEADIRSEDL